MAGTIEKRIYITPSPIVGPMLRELSELTGKPPATIVRELLDEMAPAIVEAVAAFRLLKKRPDQALAAFERMATKAAGDLAQLQLDIQTQKKPPGRKPGKKSGRGAAKGG
jgi:hypothetical protein